MDLRRTDRRPDTKLPGVPQQEVKQESNEDFSEEENFKVWLDAAETVNTYYDELVGRWEDEIDTLLVYVRLLPIRESYFTRRGDQ